jgi:hypothetical protein
MMSSFFDVLPYTPYPSLVIRAASVGFLIRSDPELLGLVGAGSGIIFETSEITPPDGASEPNQSRSAF